MPVANISAIGAPNVMKSDNGNDSIDTFVRQAIGKEPLISFSRTGDNPVQWIQLLHALDQPDLPGWPMLTPMKVQMQKCEKCSREFCSPINYRRHIRMHRRSLNVDKESHKIRDLLGAFWDQLLSEEAKDVVSFDDVYLKEVCGSSVVKALAMSLRKPGVWTLPQVYVQAGSMLLEVIQAKSSRFPISSQELFSILDDASERTFLCAGTAESVQKFVIEGEAEKALELKNLVASACLLFEQKLVKAWLAHKDAEALKCQKLLVEEEEAAQKRQAQLLERKMQKKLRQKEQKTREQSNCENVDTSIDLADAGLDSVEGPVSAEVSISQVLSDNGPVTLVDSINEHNEDVKAQNEFSIDHLDMSSVVNVESVVDLANGRLQINRCQVPKSHQTGRNGFHGSQNLQAFKLETMQKQGALRDRSSKANGGKIWTRKSKVPNDDESLKPNLLSKPNLQRAATNQMDKSNSELLIGSISVPVGYCTVQQHHSNQDASTHCSEEHPILKKNDIAEQVLKSDAVQSGRNRVVAKQWRPVCLSENRGPLPIQRGKQDSQQAVTLEKVEDLTIGEDCLQYSAPNSDDSSSKQQFSNGSQQPEGVLFSASAAKAFLSQKWKEATSADHVMLVLSPEEPEPPHLPDSQNGDSAETPSSEPEPPHLPDSQNGDSEDIPSSDIHKRQILGNAENRLAGAGVTAPASFTNGNNAKAKFRTKPGKGVTKTRYILKQKIVK